MKLIWILIGIAVVLVVVLLAAALAGINKPD